MFGLIWDIEHFLCHSKSVKQNVLCAKSQQKEIKK